MQASSDGRHRVLSPQQHGRGPGKPARQRRQILAATVDVVAEGGVALATLTRVTARARVSRQTFLAHFDDLEAAIAAVIDDALTDVSAIVHRVFDSPKSRRDRLRESLAEVLLYMDSRPELARVLLVETLTANPQLTAHRQRAVRKFGALVVERLTGPGNQPHRLATDGALAAVLGIVYSRLINPAHPPLIELIGPIMGALAPASSSQADIELELRRGQELTLQLQLRVCPELNRETASGPPAIVPKALRDPRSFRARSCLLYVAANPGSSNRQIGTGAGVRHRGQLSTLLASLCRLGLLAKQSGQPGHANSWTATPFGMQVALAVQLPRSHPGETTVTS
ncbi:MAG TPA: TetR/AcrR family transcriptional regulator [Solirubrobacteraceae bacterium]|jgi:AcrR family transcriptional regulator|nr:TetR/AcrR family transcriptional regulator [Solirubrobacteraceae bacterium]